MSYELQVGRIAAGWPRVAFGKATVEAYVWGLQDLPLDEVERAVAFALRTMTFPPTIAELRTIVAERRLNLPEGGAALELVERHVAAVGRPDHDGPQLPWPAARALKALGGSYSWRGADNHSVLRSQFLKLYDEFCREARQQITRGELQPSTAPLEIEA